MNDKKEFKKQRNKHRRELTKIFQISISGLKRHDSEHLSVEEASLLLENPPEWLIEEQRKYIAHNQSTKGKTTRKEKERIKLGNLDEYFRQWKDQGCPDENSPEWLDHLNTVLRLFNDPNEIGKTIDTWSWDCITVKYLDIERQSLEFLENEELEDHLI